MAKPSRAPAFAGTDHVHVIIETPAGRRTKYAWDPELAAFRVSKVLPSGMVFPYDFGFVAHTKSGDGDPRDDRVLPQLHHAGGAGGSSCSACAGATTRSRSCATRRDSAPPGDHAVVGGAPRNASSLATRGSSIRVPSRAERRIASMIRMSCTPSSPGV